MYRPFGELQLPHSVRTYFDVRCSEYMTYPIENKLLDLAYMVYNGAIDIKKELQNILDTHPYINEYELHRGVLKIMAAACHIDYLPDNGNPLDTDIELMLEYLMRYYVLPFNSMKHFMAKSKNEYSDYLAILCNGWSTLSVKSGKLFETDTPLWYPVDEELISKYNQSVLYRHRKQCFCYGLLPEPWYGNPLTAKVIILGNMPYYDDDDCTENIKLDENKPFANKVKEMIFRTYSLKAKSFYEEEWYDESEGIRTADAYHSSTYRTWKEKISKLAQSKNVDEQLFYDNICVINANPYHAVGGSNPLAAGLLPSHYFLRFLLRCVIWQHDNCHDSPLVVIPSLKMYHYWKKILEDVMTQIRALYENILVKTPNNNLSLSKRALGVDLAQLIINKIKQ